MVCITYGWVWDVEEKITEKLLESCTNLRKPLSFVIIFYAFLAGSVISPLRPGLEFNLKAEDVQ